MDGEVCVEEAKADITDLKNVLAVSESENKTLKAEQTAFSSRSSVRHSKSSSVLKNLIEKNQQRLLRLTELEDALTKQLLKVCAELSAVNDDISKVQLNNEHTKHRVKPHINKFGTPYFRRKESKPEDNYDVMLLRRMGDTGYVDRPSPQSWIDTEKKSLISAIESEERKRQMKEIEIEKLKIKKKMQTCIESERMELHLELENLKKNAPLLKNMKGVQLFRTGPCDYDWFKISVVDMKGKHSAQECKAMWTNYLHPFINKGRWKADEDEMLKCLVTKFEFSNWDTIAIELNTRRSAFQCMCHYQNRLNPLLMRNVWDENDDKTLTVLVKSFRRGDYIPWKKIAYCFSNCSVSNVLTRWKTINPEAVKGKFSEAEDVILLAAVRKFGKDFKKISDHFPGRTSSQLQERYKAFLKNDPGVKPWSPDEDRLIWEKVKEFGRNFSHISTFLINRNRTQIRHRYYRMLEWLKKHPGEEYPACRSGQFKIGEGPDELWKKVVNVMKDKRVKFKEVNGDALMDDESFSSLKTKLKLKKKCGQKAGYQRTFHSVDLELANFFCSIYPQNGGRHKVNYTDMEIDTNAKSTTKFLEFLCADLKRVSEDEINNDQMLSILDKLVLKRININQYEKPTVMGSLPGSSVSAERARDHAENFTLGACKVCNIKHGEGFYINVLHNAVPPNQTSLVGIRSIMLWRKVLKAMRFSSEINSERTFEECDQHDRNQVSEGNGSGDADEECSECVKEAKATFARHSDIWKSRFQSVFAWAALCSEFAPSDTCCQDADFNDINLNNKVELIEHLKVKGPKDWLKRKNKEHDWSYWKSPLIWRETAMRGGVPELVGGLHEFFEYCYEYYGICSFLSQEEKKLLVEENIKENEREKNAKMLWDKERLSNENQAAAIIVGASSAGRTLGILVAELLTVKIVKKVVLWEEDKMKRQYLVRKMEENWHLGPIIIARSLQCILYTACLVIILRIPDPRKHMKGRHPSTKFNLKLCKCAKATLWLAEKLREGNNLPTECRFVVATGSLACFSAAVLAEALADRLDPRSVVAVTADPELLPKITSTRWSLQPTVWGWPGVAHLVDAMGAKAAVAWFEPTRRALKKIAHSSLPQGRWHAEIRKIRCVPEIQQLTANEDNNKKSKSHYLSLATMRAIMNVVHLWLADVGFAAEEIISLGIFSDGTHNLPKGLVFSQPAILDCNGFWSPCDTVLPPSEGPVRLPDILPMPLRATASFGLGKCMQAIWTLPITERESVLEKEKVAAECISEKDQKIKDWLETYALVDKYEETISAEIERIAISTEARYQWLSLSERLPEEQLVEEEHTSYASGSESSLLNTEKVSDENKEQSEEFMEEVD